VGVGVGWQLHVARRRVGGAGVGGSLTRSKLNLVDLAGSERWSAHHHEVTGAVRPRPRPPPRVCVCVGVYVCVWLYVCVCVCVCGCVFALPSAIPQCLCCSPLLPNRLTHPQGTWHLRAPPPRLAHRRNVRVTTAGLQPPSAKPKAPKR